MLPFYKFGGDDAPVVPEQPDSIPYDLEEEELAAYAAEYELHLEDLNPDEFFTYSDIDDYPLPGTETDATAANQDAMKDDAPGSAADDDVEMAM